MKILRSLAALVTFALAISASGTLTSAAGIANESGSLAELVREQVAGQFKAGSNRFRVPTPEEQQIWTRIVSRIVSNRVAEASRILSASGFSYKLIRFTESTNQHRYYILREDEPRIYGWGLFVFDAQSRNPLAIEIPHPESDPGTESQGIRAFLETGARAFILSGVHRRTNRRESPCTQATENSDYAESDPAHNVNTMFDAAHRALVDAIPGTVAVQLHGMRDREVCPNVFLSTGTADVTSNAERFLNCLREKGVDASIYDGTVSCPLIASTNVQGRYSNGEKNPCASYAKGSPEPGLFIHTEQKPLITADEQSRQPVIEALKCAFPSGTR